MVPNAELTAVTASAARDERRLDSDPWSMRAFAVCAVVPGSSGLQRVGSSTGPGSSEFAEVSATCPVGQQLIGTGGELVATEGQVMLDAIVPNPALTTTTITGSEDETGSPGDWSISAYAICVDQ